MVWPTSEISLLISLTGQWQGFDTSFAFRLKEGKGNLTKNIEDMLSRLEDWTLNICKESGEETSGERIQARLITALCIRFEDKQEAAEKVRGP